MLRPIDLQNILVQSNSMERVQQTHQQSPDLQQRYLNLQIKEEKKHAKEMVKTAEETTNGRVQEKQEHEESKRQMAGQRQEGDEKKREKQPDGDEHGELIDIIV